MTTTLNKIKAHSPCKDGWNKLLNYLGKTQADNEPLSIATIIQSNGIKDAVWALRAVEGKDKEIRLFAADCAELVLHIFENRYPNDDCPRKAIQAARDYANGVIDKYELAAARDAAWDAARAAARDAAWDAARVAAWDAARAAARDAAWDAAGDAAWDAARAAARDAAWDAAGVAAWDAARVAARVAARAAARDAARVAARVAAGDAAGDAAWDAKWKEIEFLLTKYL
jgi:hypothetical protein